MLCCWVFCLTSIFMFKTFHSDEVLFVSFCPFLFQAWLSLSLVNACVLALGYRRIEISKADILNGE